MHQTIRLQRFVQEEKKMEIKEKVCENFQLGLHRRTKKEMPGMYANGGQCLWPHQLGNTAAPCYFLAQHGTERWGRWRGGGGGASVKDWPRRRLAIGWIIFGPPSPQRRHVLRHREVNIVGILSFNFFLSEKNRRNFVILFFSFEKIVGISSFYFFLSKNTVIVSSFNFFLSKGIAGISSFYSFLSKKFVGITSFFFLLSKKLAECLLCHRIVHITIIIGYM